jgi:thiamine-monophosphate kinase
MPSRDAGPGRARVERAAAPSTPSGPDRTPRAGQGRLTMAEFDLIDRIRRRALARHDVVLGIGDDAALLDVPAGRRLVVAMDTLNAGVHFPVDTAPRDVGWKALAVNLSDLAAMGAEPAWCTLSLALPTADGAWLEGFLDGFSELAQAHGIALVGGDTTRGPLSISLTAHGFLEPGRELRRDAARAGDDLWVSGTLGDAAAALPGVLAHREVPAALRARLDRPRPRLALGRGLVGLAHACIDVSDGLLADIAHVAVASGVAIEVDVDALPASDAVGALEMHARRDVQACGGDDYELCFTAAPTDAAAIEAAARRAGTAVTRIGRVRTGSGVRAVDARGVAWSPPRAGHVHFG